MNLFNSTVVFQDSRKHSARVFINELERFFEIETINGDKWKKYLFKIALRGLAAEWYTSLCAVEEIQNWSWTKVKKIFLKCFDYQYHNDEDESATNIPLDNDGIILQQEIDECSIKQNSEVNGCKTNEENEGCFITEKIDEVYIENSEETNQTSVDEVDIVDEMKEVNVNEVNVHCSIEENNESTVFMQVDQENYECNLLDYDEENELVTVNDVEENELCVPNGVKKRSVLTVEDEEAVLMLSIDLNNSFDWNANNEEGELNNERHKFIHILIMKGTKWKPDFIGNSEREKKNECVGFGQLTGWTEQSRGVLYYKLMQHS